MALKIAPVGLKSADGEARASTKTMQYIPYSRQQADDARGNLDAAIAQVVARARDEKAVKITGLNMRTAIDAYLHSRKLDGAVKKVVDAVGDFDALCVEKSPDEIGNLLYEWVFAN